MGGTLPYHVAKLEEAGIAYTIKAWPGMGYELRIGANRDEGLTATSE